MKSKKKIPSIKKYDMGYFVDPNNRGTISSAANMGAAGLNMLQSPRRTSVGLSAGSGALSGAAAGFQYAGPWGAAAGAVIGGVSGLITGGKKKQAQESQERDYVTNMLGSNNPTLTNTNVNPYGTQMYADGDTIQGPPGKNNFKLNLASIDYLNSYYNSSTFKDRYRNSSSLSSDYNKQLNTSKKAKENLKPYIINKELDNDPTGSRVSSPEINKIYSDKYNKIPLDANMLLSIPQAKKLNSDINTSIIPHEFSHQARTITPMDEIEILSRNKNKKGLKYYNDYQKNKSDNPNTDLKDFPSYLNKNIGDHHDLAPTENHADLDALRYQMFNKGIYDTRKGEMTQRDLDKVKNDPTINKNLNYKRLIKNFKDKDIIWMNNNIASNNNNQSEDIFRAEYGDTVQGPPLNPEDRTFWNGFVDHVKSKGYQNSPDLDKKDTNLSRKLFDEYNKSTNSSRNYDEFIPLVQENINEYRNKAIEQIKQGKAAFGDKSYNDIIKENPKYNFEDFMPGLSSVDGWAGSKTTSWKFPSNTVPVTNQKTGKQVDTKPNDVYASNYKDGDTVLDNNPNNQSEDTSKTNTQHNIINIQKGELLINPEDGKILQDYKGINPLTGGMYESHAKGKNKESVHNFTLADPGLFVITKKTASQYKDAIDNNDKISQKTVLMNIRNAKIAKNGGLAKNYGDGDTVGDPTGLQYMNLQQWNPTISTQNSFRPPYTAPLASARGINPLDMNSNELKSRGVTIPAIARNNNDTSASFMQDSNNNTLGNIVDGVNKYGPALLNIGQGLFGNVPKQGYAKPLNNPYTSQIISNMPTNVDIRPMINDIYSNQNLATKDIANQTNNSAVYRANRQTLASNTNKALSNVRMQASQENNRTASERASIYSGLGAQDLNQRNQERNYNFQVDDINARRDAAKQNMLNTGIEQLQQIGMNDKSNKQKASIDKYTLGLLKQIFPNTKYYNDFQIDYVNKLIKGK